MGYRENSDEATRHEIDKVNSGRGKPGSFNTIGGKMAYDRWKADQPKPRSPSLPVPVSSFPVSRSVPRLPVAGNPYTSADLPLPRSAPRAPQPRLPDWTDRLMQRIPYWALAVCAFLGALIGFAIGAASGGATAVVYAFVGGVLGLLALPAAIKLTQLALRILAVAAVVGVLFLFLWMLAHAGK
ncbi:MAG: hypothetical protein WA628_09085 [Terriglobales bacterium]